MCVAVLVSLKHLQYIRGLHTPQNLPDHFYENYVDDERS